MAEALRFETNDPALAAAADASFGRFPAAGRRSRPARRPAVQRTVVRRARRRSARSSTGRPATSTSSRPVRTTSPSPTSTPASPTASSARRPRATGRPSATRSSSRWRCRCWPGAVATSCSTPPASSAATAGSSSRDPPVPASRRSRWPARGAASGSSPRTRSSSGSARPGLEWWGMPWIQRLLPDARDAVPGARRAAGPHAAERRVEDRRRARSRPPRPRGPVCGTGSDRPAVARRRRADAHRAGRGRGSRRRARGPLAVGRRLVRRARTRRPVARGARASSGSTSTARPTRRSMRSRGSSTGRLRAGR